jgi:hypothetical protein
MNCTNRNSFSRRLAAALARASTLAGCALAPAPTNPKLVPVDPSAGAATIMGWGSTAAENARAALTAESGTRVTQLYVAFVNGVKTGFGENTVRVPAGEPDLIVTCGVYIDLRFFTYDERLAAKVERDRVYELRANPEGRRCQPYLQDITGKKG